MEPTKPEPASRFDPNMVTIRAVEPEDYEALRDIYAQPRVCFGTLQMPLPSASTWRERLKNTSPGRHMLVACVDGCPVGNLGLMLESNPRRRHVGTIGMGVHDQFAGRGVGQLLMDAALDLADNWLNLHRVELTVFSDNEAAIRLYERTGFVVEGTHGDYAFRAGQMVDAIAMARFRPRSNAGRVA